MKKLLSFVLAVISCVCIFAFAGCNDDKKACEGIYYFHDGTGQLPEYPMCGFDKKDEDTGLYPNVVGGEVDFSKFYIELKKSLSGLHLLISDNGRGVEGSVKEGFGLRSMREKAEALGGRCDFSSEPGEGFEVDITLPLDK